MGMDTLLDALQLMFFEFFNLCSIFHFGLEFFEGGNLKVQFKRGHH